MLRATSKKFPEEVIPEARQAIAADDLEALVVIGVKAGAFFDMRRFMPRGHDSSGRIKCWAKRPLNQILGNCFHQNGSSNSYSPFSTALYHASKDQHITPGRPLPGICYDFAVPDVRHNKFRWPDGFHPPAGADPNTAWLVSDLTSRKYAQSAPDSRGYPGDENTHLSSTLVMGGYKGPGYRGEAKGPAPGQWVAVKRLWRWQQCAFDWGWYAAFGHFDFGKAACPGYSVMDWIESNRQTALDLETAQEWQEALLRWDSDCLPRYGADGDWGKESKSALVGFQRDHNLRVTAVQDPFAELMLLHKYPPPDVGTEQAWKVCCANCCAISRRPRHAPLLKNRCGACGHLGCKECHSGGCCPACGNIL